MPTQPFSLNSFQNFGDFLKYLRRREHLTQLELSIVVGYSEAQIGRLEKNQRRPDITALKALFLPALNIENDPELSTHFLELAQSARQEDAPAPGVSPYKGLLFFDESDAELFFGRETLTTHVVDRVANLAVDSSSRFLAVVGASGSGKSSLIRAGLAVALKQTGWHVSTFTPGTNPVKALEMQLESNQAKAESDRFLILVDQFEETFTLCHDESERVAFIEKLLSLAQDKSKKITIVIALRADFYSHCAQYPALRRAVAAEQEYIGQMRVEELRRAIEEPAKRGGWEFEPGLVDVLLQDVRPHGSHEPEPGALPLLSHVLLATWERRRGRTFTLDGYHDSGGVRGAIAETAESVFTDQLNQTQQELARDVFLRLTELGQGTEDTRRRAALNELVTQSTEATQLRIVLNTLAEARLITLNEDSAEVSHEALIREWQRLHEWLTQDREGLLLHRHLTESAHEWETRGRDSAELYRGARLAQVREWISINEEKLNASEQAFITMSVEQEQHDALEREVQRQRELEVARKIAETERAYAEEQTQSAIRLKARNQVITIVGGFACLLAILAGFFSWTSYQNELRAKREQRASSSRELASAALANLDTNIELSTLLALQAISVTRSQDGIVLPEAVDALYHTLDTPQAELTLNGTGAFDRVIYSPNEQLILTSETNGIRTWNAVTGQELLFTPSNGMNVLDFSFIDDGQTLVTANLNADQFAIISFWDLSTGELISTTALDIDVGFASIVAGILSHDSSQIAIGDDEGKTIILDTHTGRQILQLNQLNEVWAIAFSPDDTRIATSDKNETRVWDTESGEELIAFEKSSQGITSIEFSPDGSLLAVADQNALIWVWDLINNNELYTLYGHTNTVTRVRFSPDGSKIGSSSLDRKVIVWDTLSGKQLFTLAGHINTVTDIRFAPNSSHIATASVDGTVKIWNISKSGKLPSLNTGALVTVLSPDQEIIALSFPDKPAEIWNFTSERKLFSLSAHSVSWVYSFSTDGKRLASKSPDGSISMWDAENGKELWTMYISPIGMVIPNPDGTRVAAALDTGSEPGIAKIWNIENGTPLLTLSGHQSGVWGLAYTLDGKRIATGDNTGTVKTWDAESGKELLTLEHSTNSKIRALIFSQDGKFLATGAQDGIGKIWDASTGELLLTLNGHTSTLKDFSFSLDGTRIATGGYDGTVRVWDTDSDDELLTFNSDSGGFWTVAFSPDGSRLITATDEGTIRTFFLDFDELILLAKSDLTRTLTEQECQKYLHTENCPIAP